MTDVMLALTNAKAGREDAFDAWYDAEHMPAILAADGILGAARYRAASDLTAYPYSFLARYDVAAGRASDAAASIMAARPALSDDLEGRPASWWYEALGPRRVFDASATGPFDCFVVLTNVAPGRDHADFNRFYDDVHMADAVRVVGNGHFVGAQRFRRADVPFNNGNPWEYLAIYDVAPGAVEGCFARLLWSRDEREEALAAGREPQLTMDPVIDDTRAAWFFRHSGAPA